ncbi:MAG: hypothetical protein K9G76_02490 [Bacteroidales bacterium]|nr:hypothetical protein [Bacteroidales bacterium]MCF8404168.1 hypothetical protein [Bacteroidales bacterium]
MYEELNYISHNEIAEHKTYERDSKGNVVVAYKHYQDGEKDTIKFERDHEGRLIEKVTIDSYNEEESREKIQYEGDKVVQRKISEYDELVLEENFKYDEKGNLMEHSKWSVEEEDARYVHLYNPDRTINKVLKYNLKEELISKAEYKYSGDQLIQILEESGYGKTITEIEYDDQGNAITQTEKNARNEVNNIAKRKYNENNDITETEVFIDLHGKGINQNYMLKYTYEYF